MNLVKKYPYVITDLDGTIAGKGYIINPETYEALQTYQLASDYHLFLASGRLDLMAKEYFAKLKIKTPIISCNGALIRDSLTNGNIISTTFTTSINSCGSNKGHCSKCWSHCLYC